MTLKIMTVLKIIIGTLKNWKLKKKHDGLVKYIEITEFIQSQY